MTNYRIAMAACLAFALGACGKKPAEQAGAAPAGQADAATRAGVSTGSALGSTLNAPGDYMRGMQGNVGRAEKAAAVYEKAAATHDAGKAEEGD